jgi:hypothetical protein
MTAWQQLPLGKGRRPDEENTARHEGNISQKLKLGRRGCRCSGDMVGGLVVIHDWVNGDVSIESLMTQICCSGLEEGV